MEEQSWEERSWEEMNYIAMNNLYLEIERGDVEMNLNFHNALRTMVCRTYAQDDFMRDWWMDEFRRLPGWNNF